MGKNNRSNVLLVEILIAVLFFMLSATILIQVFGAARNLAVRAEIESVALTEAQNVAEALYASEDPRQALLEREFTESHGTWLRDLGDYSLFVVLSEETTQAGVLTLGEVSAYYKTRNPDAARQQDEMLFTIPATKYREVPA